MNLKIKKSALTGTVQIPASKSHTIRAIAIAALAEGKSIIHNPLISEDALSAVNIYSALGARIDTRENNKWVVTGTAGKIRQSSEILDVGNSGTTLRLAIGSAALADKNTKIRMTGDKQIQTRPVGPLLKALKNLGAKASSVKLNDKPPVEIAGTLSGGKTEIECVTSQFLSSLILACPLASGDSVIDVTLLNEPDYVKITTDWLKWQDIKFTCTDDLKHFEIPGNQKFNAFEKQIPADFSSATFFLCAASFLPGSDILIKGLDFSDSQPDKEVVNYLRKMGANITSQEDGVRVVASEIKGCEIDMNRTPDALPAIAVTAAFAKGMTKLTNVAQARVKETDRIACMSKELKKLGATITEESDGMIIEPATCKSACFFGHHDHRIVMSMAIAGMGCTDTSDITTAEAMNVTFPGFVTEMQNLGANIEFDKK